jgi:hypothetical protein
MSLISLSGYLIACTFLIPGAVQPRSYFGEDTLHRRSGDSQEVCVLGVCAWPHSLQSTWIWVKSRKMPEMTVVPRKQVDTQYKNALQIVLSESEVW